MTSQPRTAKTSRATDSAAISEKWRLSTMNLDADLKKKRDLLWPEWSDTDVNAENWGPVSKKGGIPHEKKSKASTKTSGATKATVVEIESFEDPYPIYLPWSLQKGQITWVRPNVQFPNAKKILFSPGTPVCPDIVSNNRPLLGSEFMRSFITAVHTLCYVGYKNPFIVEWQTVYFTANTSGVPWRPWHHIYSMCKVGGNQIHNPLPNEIGKYVVRLYWLGCWRKIVVDDRYPVDATGYVLLPTTYTGNDKELDLWPALLAKALLKIASLTWTENEEIVDFDIITCLTGWNVQKIYTKGLDTSDIWEIFTAYSDYYKYVKSSGENPNSKQKATIGIKATSIKSGKKSDKASKSSKSKKSSGKLINLDAKNISATSFYIVGALSNLRNLDLIEDEENDLYPCYAHEFLIDQTKDIPLVKYLAQLVETLPHWKMHRWLDWAKAHDICTADPTLMNTKCLKIVSNLRRTDEYNLNDLETSECEKAIKKSVDVFYQFLTGFDGYERKNPNVSKKDASDKKKKIEFIDPSIWCNFNDIGPCIESISIYIKPSAFRTQYIISDLKLNGALDIKPKKITKPDDKKQKGAALPVEPGSIKYIHLENILVRGRNEPLFMFIDSIDLKSVIFSLAYLGNNFPEPEIKKSKEVELGEKKFSCKIGPCLEGCMCMDIKDESFRELNFVDTRKRAHILVENFNWKKRKIGDMNFNITTFGTTSLILDLPKGRHVYRIWLQTDLPYVLQIFSGENFKVGRLDDILESMTTESELFIRKYYKICIAFGNIVRCFGTAEYPAAVNSFYKSYQPNVILNKNQRSQVHNAFMEEFINLLKNYYSMDKHYDIIKTVKILFLNPLIKIPQVPVEYTPKKEVCVNDMSCICNKVDDNILEAAATKIEAFFKMIYFRKLKEHHNVHHKFFSKFLNLTRSIYIDIFSSKVRENTCSQLLRSLISNKNLENIAKYFTFYNDLDSVIDLQYFFGEALEFKSNVWIPLVKKVFYCNTDNPIWIRPVLYTTLSEYMLRTFNNDTGEEIDRLVNNTMVAQYVSNAWGYTILVYGWASDVNVKPSQWKLYLMVEKILAVSPVSVISSINTNGYLHGNYIPNLDKLIFRCAVKYWHTSICTFHLNTTSKTVKIKFQCVTKQGDILAVGYGISNALLPIVNLTISEDAKIDVTYSDKLKSSLARDRKDRSSKVSLVSSLKKKKKSSADSDAIGIEVFLEAYVLEDSWSLTNNEWSVVEKLRQRTSIASELSQDTSLATSFNLDINMNQQPGAERKSKLKFKIILDDPSWTLTNFYDSGKIIHLITDLHRIQEIKDIKRVCFRNTNKYFNGLEIRKHFLEDHYIKWPEKTYENAEGYDEGEDTLNFKSNTDTETSSMTNIRSAMSARSKNICVECNKQLSFEEFLFLRAPESENQMLAPFELNKVDDTYFMYRWPMSPKTEQNFISKIFDSMSDFSTKNKTFLRNMDTYLESTRNSYTLLSQWFEGIRQDSVDIMKMDEIARDYLINKGKSTTESIKDKKKNGNKKKKK